MHVSGKKIAISGLLVAFSAVMLILSSVIETNSLFLIAAASFCVGIAIREWGIRFGMGFLIASTLVNVFVAPNKFYCLTFAGMGVYLLCSECLWNKIEAKADMKNRTRTLWFGKYVIFNCIYVPTLLFFRELFFVKKVQGILLVVFWLIGQIALFVYDRVYIYFQGVIWGKFRMKLMKE